MSEDLLKKKVLVDKEPVFDHSLGGVEEAIGLVGIVENLGQKITNMQSAVQITSPSKAVEYLYHNFSKAELAFFVMHMMSQEVKTDLSEEGKEV